MYLYSLILLCFLIQNASINGEIYSALTDMEDALEVDELYIETMENYVKTQEEIIEFMKNRIELFKKDHNEAKSDVTQYLSNPLNAYAFIKRLTTHWKEVEEKMLVNNGEDILNRLEVELEYEYKVPDEEDLNGVVQALARLQKIYQMNASSLADSNLNGVQHKSNKMTAKDCFELGLHLYNSKNYPYAIMWLEEALRRLDGTEKTTLIDRIQSYLSLVHYKEGNLTISLKMIEELLKRNPTSAVALDNKAAIEEKMEEPEEPKEEPDGDLTKTLIAYDQAQYGKLCRYELKPSPKQLAPLRCRYITNDNPYLKIGPMKLEELSLHPYIVVHHDVLYDSEIEFLKEESKPRFTRAAIKNSTTNQHQILNVRTSKAAFLDDNHHKNLKQINQRIADMTNLSMDYAESLQIVNYGIGGQYDPHFDFFDADDRSEYMELHGNRIATMSDVEQGGATVFPFIDLTSIPKKGSAVFWYNLHRNGEADHRTRHASCPILFGSKWVANKWIRSNAQVFKRPCIFTPMEDDRIYLPGVGYIQMG